MEEIEVAPGCAGEGQAIGDVRGGAIIVGVRDAPTASSSPSPPAETVLRAGDVVMAMGTRAHAGAPRGAASRPAGSRART